MVSIPVDQLKKQEKQSRPWGLAAMPWENILQPPRAQKREMITGKPSPTHCSIPHPQGELRTSENAKILSWDVCGALGGWIPVDSSLDTDSSSPVTAPGQWWLGLGWQESTGLEPKRSWIVARIKLNYNQDKTELHQE